MRCIYQINSIFDMGWSYSAIWFLRFVKGQAGARNCSEPFIVILRYNETFCPVWNQEQKAACSKEVSVESSQFLLHWRRSTGKGSIKSLPPQEESSPVVLGRSPVQETVDRPIRSEVSFQTITRQWNTRDFDIVAAL